MKKMSKMLLQTSLMVFGLTASTMTFAGTLKCSSGVAYNFIAVFPSSNPTKIDLIELNFPYQEQLDSNVSTIKMLANKSLIGADKALKSSQNGGVTFDLSYGLHEIEKTYTVTLPADWHEKSEFTSTDVQEGNNAAATNDIFLASDLVQCTVEK